MSEPMLQDDSIVSQPDEARKQLYICRIQDENGAETDNLIMHDASQEELLLKEKIDGRVVLKVLKDNAGLLIFAGMDSAPPPPPPLPIAKPFAKQAL